MFLEIIADAQDQAPLEFVSGFHHRGRAGRGLFQIDDLEIGFEVGQREDLFALCVHHEGPAIEDEFVVSAHLVDEDDGHAVFPGEVAEEPPSLLVLPRMPRRGGKIQDHVDTRFREFSEGVHGVAELLAPGILANGQADPDAADREE